MLHNTGKERCATLDLSCHAAPDLSVTLNNGFKMPAWYDLKGLSERDNEECNGIEMSRDAILDLLKNETALLCDAPKVGVERYRTDRPRWFLSRRGPLAFYRSHSLAARACGSCLYVWIFAETG